MPDWRPLQSGTFRHLAAAYAINELGTWVGDVALAILVFDRTSSALATAALFLTLRFVPSLFAPLLTTRLESLNPARVLPALYVGETVLYGLIALLAHHFSLAGVLVLAALDGVLAIAAKALSRSASANELLPRGLLREGNATLNLAFMCASALGPALGGVVVAWKGAQPALALDALSFAVAAIAVGTARGLKIESDSRTGAAGRLAAGLETIRTEPGLLLLMIGFGLVLLVSSIAVPIEVVFAKQTLGAGDSGYGLLLASWGVGMIIGGSAYAIGARANETWLLAVAVALLAVGYGGMAAAPDLGIACAFSALGGIGNGVGGITVITAIQRAIPLTTQSAVMAVFEATNQAMPALGFAIGGVVTALSSPRAAYAISAGGVALVLLAGVLMPGAGSVITGNKPQPREKNVSGWREWKRRDVIAGAIHVAILGGVTVVAILTAHEVNWNIGWLAIILILAVFSELTATLLDDGAVYVSGSFLGIMLGAVLLGGAAGALIGLATISVGWLRSREQPAKLLHNLAAFACFPLVAGLAFHAMLANDHVSTSDAGYYLFVLAAFLTGLVLNFSMAQAYVWFTTKQNLYFRAKALQPIIAPELFTAILMLAAAYVTRKLGWPALLLVAFVLILFQYLVGELLQSRARGEELQVMATTDELTGFPNRKHFGDLLSAEIEASSASNTKFGVLLLDLDHFKDINDTLGHEYGDDLLAQLAPRLKAHVGENAVVARLGGDEFAVLPSSRSVQLTDLELVAGALLKCVQDPFTVGDVTMTVNASVGISRYPIDGDDAQTLLRRADIALHDAKRHRDGHSFYDPDSDHHSARRLSLVGDFRKALESDDQLVLHYHPIIEISTGRVHGAEALVRWRHPERGLLTPAAFLRTVEHTGLITEMTTHVLERATADCVAWEAAGQILTVGVNLSVRDLHHQGLPRQVAETLVRNGLDAHRLKLEITESMIMSDPERALATVRGLRAVGVTLAVDDFGTGHASLANLRLLPVDELKIDRSFVTPMLREPSDMVIVRSTIELGHALGLWVIAEGVEDARTLDELRRLGCDRAQGHHLSQPIPANEFLRWAQAFQAWAT